MSATLKAGSHLTDVQLRDHVLRHPSWLRTEVIADLGAHPDPEARQFGARLDGLRAAFLTDPIPLQDPRSPLVKLWLDVDVLISFPDALEAAGSPRITECLSEPYANAISALVLDVSADPGRADAARTLLLLFEAAATHVSGVEAASIGSALDVTMVASATATLVEILDPLLFRRAIAAGMRQATGAEAAGDRDAIASWHAALAALLAEPYVGQAAASKATGMRRAFERAMADAHAPAMTDEDFGWVLDFDARLDEALSHADRAIELSSKADRPLYAFTKLNILRRATTYNRAVDRQEFERLVRASASLANHTDLILRIKYLTAIAPVESRRLAEALAELTRQLVQHPEVLTGEAWSATQLALVVAEAAQANSANPAVSFRALDALHPALDLLPDTARGRVLTAEYLTLLSSFNEDKWFHDALGSILDSPSIEAAHARLVAAGRLDERVSPARRAHLLLSLGILPLLADDPMVPLGLVDQALELAPELLERQTAIFLAVASTLADRVELALGLKQYERALVYDRMALRAFAGLGLPDTVDEVLQLIFEFFPDRDEALDRLIADFVIEVFDAADPVLSDSGRRTLRRLAEDLLERVGRLYEVQVFALVGHLAGWRFGAALQRVPASGVSDETQRLIKELSALHDADDDLPLPRDYRQQEIELLVPQRGYLSQEGRPSRRRMRQLQERSLDEQLWRSATIPPDMEATTEATTEAPAAGDRFGPDDAVLVFHVSPTKVTYPCTTLTQTFTAQWPITAEGIRIKASSSWLTLSSIETEIFETRRLIQQEPGPFDISEEGRGQLRHIGTGFFAGLETQLDEFEQAGVTHLCFVATGPLLMMPFHLAEVGGRPLVDRFSVSYAPHWRLATRRSGSGARRGVSAFGVRGGGQLPKLDNAADEARAVAATAGVAALVDDHVTVPAIRSALSSSRYVHIAAHGGQVPYASSLHWIQTGERGGDGRLRASDLLDLDLHGLELVTLSTCESGTLTFDEFGDARGIPAALFLAGADAVVATMWPVETSIAQFFFEHLYRELAQEQAPFAAFVAAQRATRRESNQLRDWGAFTFMGRW